RHARAAADRRSPAPRRRVGKSPAQRAGVFPATARLTSPDETSHDVLRIEVGPGDLAASRFAIAPLAELEALLRKLDRPDSRTATGRAVRASRWAQRYTP